MIDSVPSDMQHVIIYHIMFELFSAVRQGLLVLRDIAIVRGRLQERKG